MDVACPASECAIHSLISCQYHFFKWKNHFSGKYMLSWCAGSTKTSECCHTWRSSRRPAEGYKALSSSGDPPGSAFFCESTVLKYNALIYSLYLSSSKELFFLIQKALFWVYRMIGFHHCHFRSPISSFMLYDLKLW